MIHIYPEWEADLHELEGTCCKCRPRVEWEHAECLVVHGVLEPTRVVDCLEWHVERDDERRDR